MGSETVRDRESTLRTALRPNGESPSRKFALTPRELQAIRAILMAYTNKDIAKGLVMSQETLKHHLVDIFDKLGVSFRLELALHAAQRHLVETA
jgi:two-component system, NarL family, nitrate/nitrite response regulator NarL